MKIVIVIVAVVLLIMIASIVGALRTRHVQSSPRAKKFQQGKLPSNLNGFYKGSVTGYRGPWQGKEFDGSQNKGVNVFADGKKYPFKTYAGKGLRDDTDVLKIDYDVPENPWWTRRVLDEIVEIAPNKYLDKLHLRIVPGFSVALGYFELER